MKTQMGLSRYAALKIASVSPAAGSNKIMEEVNCGGAKSGVLILTVTLPGTGSDLANLEVWTSSRSDFATDTSALSAIASDSLAKVVLTSDSGSFYAKGTTDGSLSDVTIASNIVANITQTGMYCFRLANLAKFCQIQYDNDGAGSQISAVFVGEDLADSPYPGERSAYS